MKTTFFSFLRRSTLMWMLVATGVATMAPPVVHSAQAQRKKRKGARGKRKPPAARGKSDPSRSIQKESNLAPKRDVGLDDDITKTKDLKTDMDVGTKPTLSPDQLLVQEMEALMDEKLDEEVQLSRSLLEYETDCEGGAPVRFRLADLYWEKSKRAFFKSQDFNLPQSDRARHEQLMKRLQNSTVQHYMRIVEECADYTDYAKTLFYLGRTLMELDRPKEAAQYFTRIIKEFEDSEWISHAWFMVGEYYFNAENDAPNALRAYKRAAEYPRSPIFGFAVYKQGWCYINTGDWDLALARFRQVVTVSDDPSQNLDAKARASLRKEALKDYVRAYSHVGAPNQAFRDFLKTGGKKHVQRMMENLGQWYINRDSHRDTITVYRDLIRNFAESTRLPIYQGHVVDATSRFGDKKATVGQAKLLTKYFDKVRRQAENPRLTEEQKTQMAKDVREGEDIAENTLRRLATEYHKEARKLSGRTSLRTFEFARDLYGHYLEVFPEPVAGADVNYVFFMRFYYAEVLYKLEDFLLAARNYDKVVEMNPDPKDPKEREIVMAAAEEAVRSYDELVEDLDRKNPPVVSGTEPKPIPDIKQDLIHACKRYIDYVGKEGEKIVEIRYKMARIYYTYNHFDKAAPAFHDIVTNHADHEVACLSANLALDIYNGLKDYENLRKASRSYLASKTLACGDEDRQKFAKIEQQSSFKLIEINYEKKKRHIAAANKYMQFYQDFPSSELADTAVYNAAVNYDLGNRLDKANEVRKFLVDRFPNSKLVPETLYNIAQSYERIVDFQNAAQYLKLFSERYPKDERSKDAIYNSGLYRATLRDYAASREDRERFLKLYPDDKDAADVAFSICESLEDEANHMEAQATAQKNRAAMDKPIRKKWEQAHDCYYNWIRNSAYTRSHVDLLCYSQHRRGEIMRDKTNYAKGFQEQKKYVLTNWSRWQKNPGKDKMPRCANAVAELLFQDIQVDLKRYLGLRISELNPTPKGKKAFDASRDAKVKERDRLVARYQEVVEIGVAEWALAALFQIGVAYQDSIDKLLAAPIPNQIPGYKLTDEDKEVLRGELQKMVQPIEETVVEAFSLCVEKANELGVYNKWSMRAFKRLQGLRPQQFPPVLERLTPVAFDRSYSVARNGLVIPDGEGFKAADVKLEDKTPRNKPQEKDASDEPAEEGEEPSPDDPAQQAAFPATSVGLASSVTPSMEVGQ